MAKFCLTKEALAKFKQALKDGTIHPDKLSSMTSEERNSLFSGVVGKENATEVNALFESKLLLKNQKAGMISWAKRTLNGPPKIQRDIISKIEGLQTYLSPDQEDNFYKDLISTKLGVGVSYEQAKEISDLSKKVTEAKETSKVDEMKKLSAKEGIAWMKDKVKNEKRLDYGRKVIALDNYMSKIKSESEKMTLSQALRNPVKAAKEAVKTTLGASKSSKASLDQSALLNQGFPILSNVLTAGTWLKNASKSFADIVRVVGGDNVWDEIRADAVSRPNYLNGTYKEQGLAVTVTEEDFPTSIPEKLPLGLGKVYKATEVSFTGFQLRNRLDVFDLFASIAETTGNKDITGLGSLVNSLTSRGSVGKLEPVANIINAPFFSLRKQAAAVDSLLLYQTGEKSGFTRALGASAALQQILLTAAILSIAKALKPDSVEDDPTSADYGKIKVGDTRFDVTQGRSSYVTLAMRIATGKFKSSTTDNVSELNEDKFGSKNKTGVIWDFTENKLSPFVTQAIALLNQQDRQGNKPTAGSVFTGLYVPLGFENIKDTMKNPNAANIIAIALANHFGIQNNTYPVSNLKAQYIPEGEKINNDSFIDAVSVYAKALKTDPETAFNRMFTGQRIVKVSGDAIIVERLPLKDSQEIKKKAGANNPTMKLDHTIPLELGGSNDTSNLKLVTTSEHSSYTSVENALGRALKANKISKAEAQKLIADFKQGKIKKEDVLNRIK